MEKVVQRFLIVAALITFMASPGHAQSFDPDAGTGNATPFSYGTTVPQHGKVAARPNGIKAFAMDPRIPATRDSNDPALAGGGSLGGGCGRRLQADTIEQAVSFARQVEYPLKLIWTREQDIRHDRFRPAYYDHIAAGLDEHGSPIAWTHRIRSRLGDMTMPAFAQAYSDAEIAALSNYVLEQFGAKNGRVTATMVAQARTK